MKFLTSRNCSLMEARTLLYRTTCPNSWMIFSPRSTLPRWLFAISSTNRSSKMSLSINCFLLRGGTYEFRKMVEPERHRHVHSRRHVAVVMSHQAELHTRLGCSFGIL